MDKTVIIIMIICATVIALVAIICDYLFERKSSESSECLMSKKIVKIHRNYIAGFLGFAIIMLLTARYGGPNNAIFEYLSFGSTITSLVLSILAIFVTVQSSSDLYKQFTRIDNATDTIKNVSSQIDDTLENLKDAERSLQNSSQNISQQLNNIVDQIDERLKARMKETEGNIYRQFAESMNVNTNDQEQKIQQDLISIEKVKEFFFSMTSANGLLAIYACSLSKEKKKMFELSKLFNGNEAYTFGFLIAAISTGLVNFTNDDMNNQITCHDTPFSSTETLDIIKNRLKQQQLGSEYLDRLNGIHIFFGLSPLKITIE